MIRYIDMHCDTLMKAFFSSCEDLFEMKDSMFQWEPFFRSGGLLQFLAVFFLPRQENPSFRPPFELPDDETYFARTHAIYEETFRRHPDELMKVRSAADYDALERSGKRGGLLTLEDGRILNGRMEVLDRMFEQDVRLISLTWNHENCLGFPNSPISEVMRKGLKPFGKEAVAYMQKKGILVDVSHLSDGGFRDVADICGPFVASHSNCRELCPHPRNLTDDMIRTLGEHGGVMGLNFCPGFVDPSPNPVSTAARLAEHARHAARCGGIDVVAIGSDFDGISGSLEISSPDHMELLWEALRHSGFTESEIDKIAHKNAARLLREALPAV